MACNPEEGIFKEMNPENLKELGIAEENLDAQLKKLAEIGFTAIFSIGEEIEIKGCRFVVNNFVEEHGFMNLKIKPKLFNHE